MNNVQLVGRLTKDPEIRGTGEKVTVSFPVAVSRNFKNAEGKYESDFINCVAFGKTGDFVTKYFKKGQLIGVIGSIRTGSYVKQDGTKVYTTNVSVNNVEFVGKKEDNDGFTPVTEDDELPFN